jgi:hypothetical protein
MKKWRGELWPCFRLGRMEPGLRACSCYWFDCFYYFLQRMMATRAHCEDILANGGGGGSCFGPLGFARMKRGLSKWQLGRFKCGRRLPCCGSIPCGLPSTFVGGIAGLRYDVFR